MPGLLGSDDIYLGGLGFCTRTSGFSLGTASKRPVVAADPDQMNGLGDRLYRTAAAAEEAVWSSFVLEY
ncbi:hypothetical protein AB0H42_19650 [Nocardia sp. NPDC050799]|uniref:hypothetical protein n=1 Tax=Nocardia sp. NPDC050799 TaxID=3154842 RepID=UPI0033D31893